MTEEILKNNEKFVKKENTKKEGGRTRKPYNRKKKEFSNEVKEAKIVNEKNNVEIKNDENKEVKPIKTRRKRKRYRYYL